MLSPNHDGAARPRLGRGFSDALDGFAEPASGAEDAEPAIAVRGGAPDGGVARAADDQRDPRVRRGQDAGVAEGEELSLVVDGLTGGQRAKYLERLVQSAASRRGVHAGVRDLAAVLASDTDSEYQPGGRYLGDGRELSRRHHGVSQSREVDTDERLEGIVGGEDRRCRHQAVEARAALEADVVTGGDVVQAGAGDVVEDPSPRRRVGDEQSLVDRHPQLRSHGRRHRGRHSAATLPIIAVAMIRFWIPAVPSAIR